MENPELFVRKVRQPCGQLTEAKCKGVCGWTPGGQCRVRVPPKLTDLFKRLLEVLVTNPKQRAVVLDGRASPFFSTILYLELPHELFLTDAQVGWEKTGSSE